MANPILSFNGRNINRIVFNGRDINRVIFNGIIVWSKNNDDSRLSLEKLNVYLSEKNQQITVQGAGGSGVTATIVLNQTAGDPTLEVSPTSIDVPQDGSEVSVQVTTNTTFTVS